MVAVAVHEVAGQRVGGRSRARRRPFAEVPADARQYAVAMADGVRLATDVYLPERGTRWPTLLSRLPYDKAGDECFLPAVARWFTERGFAVVVQDVRGKVRSGGELAPFEAEIADGYATLDWVAAQRWSTGRVGMFGDSYYGFTQWAAAASGHPALGALAPRVCSADFRDLLGRQGVLLQEVAVCWALETWVDEALYDYDGELDWSVRPLERIVPTLLGGRRPVGLDDWALGRMSPAATLPISGDVPALHLGGFGDILLGGQLATWRRARAAGRAPQHLLLDATDHGWTPLREPGEPYRDPQAGPSALQGFLDGYLGPLLPFFRRHLGDGPDARDAPARWRLARTDRWQQDGQWPPRAAEPVSWSLAGDPVAGNGALSRIPERSARTVGWVHDPGDPVPSRIHPYFSYIDLPDERDLDARPDVLTFSTAELTRPLDLAGPARLEVTLSAGAPSTHLVATLYEVFPDGAAYRISGGAAAATAPWPARSRVELGDLGHRLRPGHRLRLTVASSAYPHYVLHPGTDAHPWTATSTAPAQQHLVLGGAEAALLTCTVIDRTENDR